MPKERNRAQVSIDAIFCIQVQHFRGAADAKLAAALREMEHHYLAALPRRPNMKRLFRGIA
jgi:hypothetical protein